MRFRWSISADVRRRNARHEVTSSGLLGGTLARRRSRLFPAAPMLPRTAVERVLYGSTDEIGSRFRRQRLFDPIPIG
jgi:hypothetical protein